jgi:hypothetical protein
MYGTIPYYVLHPDPRAGDPKETETETARPLSQADAVSSLDVESLVVRTVQTIGIAKSAELTAKLIKTAVTRKKEVGDQSRLSIINSLLANFYLELVHHSSRL